jgi:phosphatidylserine/phosphatidylglycerophosphate/cardiolipin synthase-like enzyme
MDKTALPRASRSRTQRSAASTCSISIWSKDLTGQALLESLVLAADCGVRVRVLLDDLGSAHSDRALLALDSHPNIEIRLFNPVTFRSSKLVGIVAELSRIDRRMHNKSFIADGRVAIVGGATSPMNTLPRVVERTTAISTW